MINDNFPVFKRNVGFKTFLSKKRLFDLKKRAEAFL